jgi:hypothetical protein
LIPSLVPSGEFWCLLPCCEFLSQVRFIGSNHVTSHELLAFNMVWLGLQVQEDCAALFASVYDWQGHTLRLQVQI